MFTAVIEQNLKILTQIKKFRLISNHLQNFEINIDLFFEKILIRFVQKNRQVENNQLLVVI